MATPPRSNKGVGEGLRQELLQGCCCSALSGHCRAPGPAPAPSATAFLSVCRKGSGGEGQCPLGTQLRGTWDPEVLACGLRGLPSPRRAASKGADGGNRPTPRWGGTPEPGAVDVLAGSPRGVHLPVDTCPSTDLGPRGGPWSALLLFLRVTLNPWGQSSACPPRGAGAPPDPPPPSSSCRPRLR